jgi:hypothetical protein
MYAPAKRSLSPTLSLTMWFSASCIGITASKSPKASGLFRYSMSGTLSNPCGALSPLVHAELPSADCVQVVLSALSYMSSMWTSVPSSLSRT